ncbi:hypothetical protein DPMN_054500 [Dreissena polymorpha]|uniref:Uncharacterized protein n=1 Tax=Dreissena polymorpha TaxID=45954 RepID=A0A9D4CQG5_DREPO|nr:hypothetical protein DPMN_054500 [Dreissena polymorpha]
MPHFNVGQFASDLLCCSEFAAVMMETQTMFNSMGRSGVPKLALLVMEGDVIFDEVRTVRDQLQADASVGVDMEVLAFNPELGFMMPNWGRVIITPSMDANIVACE